PFRWKFHQDWAFRDEKLQAIGLSVTDTLIHKGMGRILDKLVESQGIEIPSEYKNGKDFEKNRPKFKLSFSWEIFPDYQIILQSIWQSRKKTTYYRVIEGPAHAERGAISEKVALFYFSNIPEYIYAKVDLVEGKKPVEPSSPINI
ncbi:MAG: hypothetical protein ACXACP_07150, partial [Candidatus Hodarchaeales archaeon]